MEMDCDRNDSEHRDNIIDSGENTNDDCDTVDSCAATASSASFTNNYTDNDGISGTFGYRWAEKRKYTDANASDCGFPAKRFCRADITRQWLVNQTEQNFQIHSPVTRTNSLNDLEDCQCQTADEKDGRRSSSQPIVN